MVNEDISVQDAETIESEVAESFSTPLPSKLVLNKVGEDELKKMEKKEKLKATLEKKKAIFKEVLQFLRELSEDNEELKSLYERAKPFLTISAKAGVSQNKYSILGKLRSFIPMIFEENPDKVYTVQDLAWKFFVEQECENDIAAGFKLMASKGKNFHKELADCFWYIRNKPNSELEPYWITALRDANGDLAISDTGLRQYKLYGIGEQPSNWPKDESEEAPKNPKS